ncbi:DPY30 domain-containing protein 2 [Rhynchonycteris naso]
MVHRMETNYLKRCFGKCLAQALAEVAEVRPSDPIEYLAHWLYHYRQITKAEEEDRQEKAQLKEEYDNSLKEAKMTEMLKQEEYQIQQEREKSHQPPRAVASSTKTKFKQCLPGTSIVIPGMPQQTPSADPPGQMDKNAGTSQEINY